MPKGLAAGARPLGPWTGWWVGLVAGGLHVVQEGAGFAEGGGGGGGRSRRRGRRRGDRDEGGGRGRADAARLDLPDRVDVEADHRGGGDGPRGGGEARARRGSG